MALCDKICNLNSPFVTRRVSYRIDKIDCIRVDLKFFRYDPFNLKLIKLLKYFKEETIGG